MEHLISVDLQRYMYMYTYTVYIQSEVPLCTCTYESINYMYMYMYMYMYFSLTTCISPRWLYRFTFDIEAIISNACKEQELEQQFLTIEEKWSEQVNNGCYGNTQY